MKYSSVELCAGAGGAAFGLEQAGFNHVALVEIDDHACATLRLNRPKWNVIQADLKNFDARKLRGVDFVSAGVPCPPFSKAGKQLGKDDERDLFPHAIRIISEIKPKAIMLENVKGLLDPVFDSYRASITEQLKRLGYIGEWKLLNASDFGTSQLRPRVIFVGMKKEYWKFFSWPEPSPNSALSVGELLYKEMSRGGWKGAAQWRKVANAIAPTLVGGSKKHGGPDLGPSRARKAWEKLGINGKSLADEAPDKAHIGPPRLTVTMAALLQGFPESWQFYGKKTAAYRQVGNAFPAPVAKAVGEKIFNALRAGDRARARTNRSRDLQPSI